MREHRTIHAFSDLAREPIRRPELDWLRDIRWPTASAVLDGEAVADDGSAGASPWRRGPSLDAVVTGGSAERILCYVEEAIGPGVSAIPLLASCMLPRAWRPPPTRSRPPSSSPGWA